jgi:hypothetical protein
MQFDIRKRQTVSTEDAIQTLSEFITEKTPHAFGSPKKQAEEGDMPLGYNGTPTVNEDVRYQLKAILDSIQESGLTIAAPGTNGSTKRKSPEATEAESDEPAPKKSKKDKKAKKDKKDKKKKKDK